MISIDHFVYLNVDKLNMVRIVGGGGWKPDKNGAKFLCRDANV